MAALKAVFYRRLKANVTRDSAGVFNQGVPAVTDYLTRGYQYLVDMVRARTDPIMGLVDSWSEICSDYNQRFGDDKTVRQVRHKYYHARKYSLTQQGAHVQLVLDGINGARVAMGLGLVSDLADPVMRAFLRDGFMPNGRQWEQVSQRPHFACMQLSVLCLSHGNTYTHHATRKQARPTRHT